MCDSREREKTNAVHVKDCARDQDGTLSPEPPPSFDETGLATYKELCRSMQLKPIQRFERQLHEGVVDLKVGRRPPGRPELFGIPG